jgi:two-component sensor histidine kinase
MGTLDITAMLVALVRGLNESIVLIDNTGRILHSTESAAKLVNESPLTGRSIFDFIAGPAERVKSWLASLDSQHFRDVKIQLLRSGKAFPARMRMAAWKTGENEFIVFVAIVDSTYIERRNRDLLRKSLTIEYLSRSRKIREGQLHDSVHEILVLCSRAVNVERVNAWLYNKDAAQLECIGNYDSRSKELVPQKSLPRIATPNYFHAFETQKIIVTEDSRLSDLTSELVESYLIPNDIYSMMDVPVRSEGEIVGVICFEKVGRKREWTLSDQKFGLIAAQMVSLALETHKRKMMEQELAHSLREQQLLLVESNHRIRNNLAVMASLMRMQLDKCRDDYHRALMQDSLNRLYSIVNLHDLLTGLQNRVNFSSYVDKLLEELGRSLTDPGKSIQIISSVEEANVSSSLAVNLGLIITEIVTNSLKHAFAGDKMGCIRVEMETKNGEAFLSVSDTGSAKADESPQGQGSDIISGLAEHINGRLTISRKAGYTVELRFPLV